MPRACTTSDPFNAIAEPRRRHILEFLAGDERSVGEIVDALEMGQPSVSKHLQVLHEVGLVTLRRDGRKTMVRINPKRSEPFTAGLRCSSATGARSCAASRHTPRRTDDDDRTGQ